MIDTYVSIDLETTGLSPRLDRIIEIGAVKVVKGEIRETFSTFINPGRALSEKIVELTGIHDSQLAQAPMMEEVLPKLLDFLEDLPLVGHRILFDYSFLKKAAVNQKLTFEREAIDTLKIAEKHLKSLEHKRLGYLCEYYGIPIMAHRALEDARATAALYEKLVQEFYSEEDGLFCPKVQSYQVKRDTPATKPQKERLYRLLELHKIEIDYDVDKLTRSEASRITDKILAKYGR